MPETLPLDSEKELLWLLKVTRHLLNQSNLPSHDHEDALQNVCVEVLQAQRRYLSSKMTWHGYAYSRIQWAIKSHARRKLGLKGDRNRSLPVECLESERSAAVFARRSQAACRNAAQLESVLADCFPHGIPNLLLLWVETGSQRELAQRIGRSESRVSQLVGRELRKARRSFELTQRAEARRAASTHKPDIRKPDTSRPDTPVRQGCRPDTRRPDTPVRQSEAVE